MNPSLRICFTSFYHYTESIGKIKHQPSSLSIFWGERMMRMNKNKIYIAGATPAGRFAHTYLQSLGLPLTQSDTANAGHLLLDVPSFGPGGQLRMGGDIESLLQKLPEDVIVYGGNMNHPALVNHRTVDFLRDPDYLAQNAWITAECALDVALPYLTVTVRDCPVLILGWGRIGKCLGQLLNAMGADVTVAARKESDRAMLRALGYNAADTADLSTILGKFRLILNTVPSPVISRKQAKCFRDDCVCIELASTDGIDHEDVIIARGLPGIHLPESSGKLIAETFLGYYQKEVTL